MGDTVPPKGREGFAVSSVHNSSQNGGLTSTPSDAQEMSPKNTDDVLEHLELSQAQPKNVTRQGSGGVISKHGSWRKSDESARSRGLSQSGSYSTSSSSSAPSIVTGFQKSMSPMSPKGKRAIVEALQKVDTRGLFSYVPNILLQTVANRPVITFEQLQFKAATCFIDVCGFTRITEEMRRSADGSNGIAEHLNKFFSLLLRIVEDCGGDVVQFSGDAILCIWKSDGGDDSLQKVCRRSLRCVMTILAATKDEVIQFSEKDTPIRLGVHMSLAVGDVRFTILGGVNDAWRYVTTGLGVRDAVDIVDLAGMDELAISPAAHALIVQDAKVRNLLADDLSEVYADEGSPCSTPLSASDHSPLLASSTHVLAYKYAPPHHPSLGRIPSLDPSKSLEEVLSFKEGIVRSKTGHSPAEEEGLKYKVYSFLFDTIINHWGKEGEIRTVSTIFIHVTLNDEAGIADPSFQAVLSCIQAELVTRHGILNKVLYDDKGATLLCVFGLPGHSNEDDALRALAFAWTTCCKLEGSKCTLAYGISRAKVYCGICGSASRKEYTVLGDGVNVAARVMQQAVRESKRRAEAQKEDALDDSASDTGEPQNLSVVCVDDTTKNLCGSSFKFVGGNDMLLKGKAIGTKVWEVTEGPGGRGSRRGHGGSLFSNSAKDAMKSTRMGRGKPRRGMTSSDELAELDELDALSGANDSDSSDKSAVHVYGRETQLSAAYEMLGHIQRIAKNTLSLAESHPSARAMVIYGDAAMGKSIMLKKISDEGQTMSMTVLSAQASPLDKDTPYYIISSLMQSMARRNISWLAADIDLVDRELRPLLNTLMPHLNITETETTMMLTDEERQDAVFDVIRGLFRREFAAQPVLICVDDIHYADTVSLGAITHVLRSLPCVAAIVTERLDGMGAAGARLAEPVRGRRSFEESDREEGDTSAFRDWGGSNAFERSGPTVQMHLPPLTKSDTSMLLRRVLKCHVEDQVVNTVHKKAGGNPGFSEQILVSLVDGMNDEEPVVIVDDNNIAKFADGVDVSNLQLPDGIEGIVTQRVDKLSPEYQTYLKAAAVIGATFSLGLLSRVMQVDLLALTEALAKLESLGFISGVKKADFENKSQKSRRKKNRDGRKASSNSFSRAASGGGIATSTMGGQVRSPRAQSQVVYTFRLQLMKDVLYSMLLAKEKRETHLRVAEELERDYMTGQPMDPQALIHHFTAADHSPRALQYLGRAADDAILKGFPPVALKYLRQALDTDDHLAPTDSSKATFRRKFHWLAMEAEALYQQGHMQSAYDRAESAMKLAGEPPAQSVCGLGFLNAVSQAKLWRATKDRVAAYMEKRKAQGKKATDHGSMISSSEDAANVVVPLSCATSTTPSRPPVPPPPPSASAAAAGSRRGAPNPLNQAPDADAAESPSGSSDGEGGDAQPLAAARPPVAPPRPVDPDSGEDPLVPSVIDLFVTYHVLTMVSFVLNSTQLTTYYATRGLLVAEGADKQAFRGIAKGKRGSVAMVLELLHMRGLADERELSAGLLRSLARYPTDAAQIERMAVLACCNTGLVKTMDYYLSRHRNVVDDVDFATTAMVHLSASCTRALCARPDDANKRLLACAKVAHAKSDKRVEAYSVLISVYIDLVVCGGEVRRAQASGKMSRALGLALSDSSKDVSTPRDDAEIAQQMRQVQAEASRRTCQIFSDRLLFFLSQCVNALIAVTTEPPQVTLMRLSKAHACLDEMRDTPHVMVKLIALHALLEVSHDITLLRSLKMHPEQQTEHFRNTKTAIALLKAMTRTLAPARPLHLLIKSLHALRVDEKRSGVQDWLTVCHEEATVLHMPFISARSKAILAAEFLSPGRTKEVLGQVRELFFRAGTSEELQGTYGATM